MSDQRLCFMAERMRQRAEEARMVAESFHDPVAKAKMMKIAKDYDRLALCLEMGAQDD